MILNRVYSWWSTYPTATTVGAYCVFIMTVICIGVLIVCFTTKRPSMFILFLDVDVICLEIN